jgi:hypothetical protein
MCKDLTFLEGELTKQKYRTHRSSAGHLSEGFPASTISRSQLHTITNGVG